MVVFYTLLEPCLVCSSVSINLTEEMCAVNDKKVGARPRRYSSSGDIAFGVTVRDEICLALGGQGIGVISWVHGPRGRGWGCKER